MGTGVLFAQGDGVGDTVVDCPAVAAPSQDQIPNSLWDTTPSPSPGGLSGLYHP